MKVIKEGNRKPKYTREVTCTGAGNPGTDGCGAVLEVEKEDLRFYNGNSGYFEREDAVVMRCPCCGGITDLERKDWPKDMDLKPFTKKWADEGIDNPRTEQWVEYEKHKALN